MQERQGINAVTFKTIARQHPRVFQPAMMGSLVARPNVQDRLVSMPLLIGEYGDPQ